MKVEAYFRGIKSANQAVDTLISIGYKEAVADLNDHYVGHANPISNIPGTDKGPVNQSSLVLNEGEPLEDARLGPLAAASPMVSGMGGFEEIADVNYRVIANVEEKDSEKVKQLLNKMGGDLRDPNFRMPKGLENVSQDEIIARMIDDVLDE